MRMFALAAWLVALLIFGGAATSASANDTLDVAANGTTPLSFTLSSCNGDTVAVKGTLHSVSSLFVDQSGALHQRLHLNATATGIGVPSGLKYVLNQEQSFEVNLGFLTGGNGAATETDTEPGELVVQKQGRDLYVAVVVHVTITPLGAVPVDHFEFVVACQ